MGGISISGLATGIDAASLIDQLMNLERAPQRQLQSRKSDIENTIRSYKELNTLFKTLREAADELSSPADWLDKLVTSSDDGVVSAEVTGNPVNGSVSFTVSNLAAAHAVVSDNTVAGKTAVVADGTDFTVNGTTITSADYGGGTLDEVVAAINAADAGVTAAAVQVTPGNYRLQISANESGSDSTFSVAGTGLTAALGNFGIVTQGDNATITIGDGPAAYQVESSTNTFTDVLPGLTFTAQSTGAATLTIANDAESLADKVEAMVTAMDDISQYILDRTEYDSDSGSVGVFLGQQLPSNLRNDLVSALIDPVRNSNFVGTSVGIETDRDGNISFDRDKFIEAYSGDPEGVEAFFGINDIADDADDGIAERLADMAEEATAINTGRIAIAISGRESEIGIIDDRIESWDVRLELRETALRRQFTAMETTLSRLQQQGQWLAGQVASLPGPRTRNTNSN